MKKYSYLILFLLLNFSLFKAQNFTWVRGDNTSGVATGTYGTLGVPSVSNNPGHRHGAATWVDTSGNFWLYGGEGYSTSSSLSWLSDLWKYNPTTNEWTWVHGSSGANAAPNYGTQNVAATTNEPGAREFAASWKDNQGNFWMFGGANNLSSGWLGDLWKYNPANNMWTWVKGFNLVDNNGLYGTMGVTSPTNMPGCRSGAGTWVDNNGNLWLFGGRGFATTGGNQLLNDLWKYEISNNNWTWISGTSLGSQNGNFGSMGVPSVTNNPGGLEFPACWIDNNNQFYLFAGRGYVGSGNAGYTGNMWRYNSTTNEWTWLKGANLTNQNCVYGTQGVSSPGTIPGGRYAPAAWNDGAGNFWLFGGLGFTSSNIGTLNDLYKYNPATNEFTWMKGNTIPNPNGIYGTLGIAAPGNIPGGRYFTIRWKGLNNTLWLMGSEGHDISATTADNMNDLWKFDIPCNPDSIIVSPAKSICSGSSLTFTAVSQFPANVQWYSGPISTVSIGSGSVLATGSLNASSGQSVYTYYAESNSCTLAPRTAIDVTVVSIPQISVTGNAICTNNMSATLIASGAQSYTWSNGVTSATNIVAAAGSGSYVVTGANQPGCISNYTTSITINPTPTVSVVANNTAVCLGSQVILFASGAQTYTWTNGGSTGSGLTFTPAAGGIYSVVGANQFGCTSTGTVSLLIFPLPALMVTAIPSVICYGPVQSSSLNALGAITYTWSNGTNGNITVVTPPSTTVTTLHTYTVAGTDANGCTNSTTISILMQICEGVSENHEANLKYAVFPNPNNGGFTIDFENDVNTIDFALMNFFGETLYIEKLNRKTSYFELNLARGFYFIVLSREGKKIGGLKLVVD